MTRAAAVAPPRCPLASQMTAPLPNPPRGRHRGRRGRHERSQPEQPAGSRTPPPARRHTASVDLVMAERLESSGPGTAIPETLLALPLDEALAHWILGALEIAGSL